MNLKLKHPFGVLYIVSFIFAMQYGLVLYINSSFLEFSVGEKIVGLIFTIASALSILVLLEMPRLLNRFGNYKTVIFFVLMNAAALIFLGIGKSSLILIIFFLLFTVASNCLIFSLDVFIENDTLEGKTGRTRGLFLTIRNSAILLSPFAAVLIITKASYFGVYISAGFMTLLSLLFIIPCLKNFKDPVYNRIPIRETFDKIKSDDDLKKIYLLEFLLNFFYSWMIIYTPIYLHQYVGLSWEKIGVILTVMLIPFVMVDYPLGRWSDTMGEKKILTIGFLLISLSTAVIFIIKTQSIIIWALVLFTTRIGAAAIEVMNESYFFKKIRARDAGLIGVFRNLFPLAFIVAPLAATILFLSVSSFEYLFISLSAVMLFGFFVTLRLKDVR